ncbi:unnamed protein product [Dovyalis caffra]|uniref:Uncharacterized protein n=1 Tax=Dovyalis caffra TaxID=77055 RepID=A0AAV1RK27_9ROSI|nr:unnamed protein product [Dovyalis caffra]
MPNFLRPRGLDLEAILEELGYMDFPWLFNRSHKKGNIIGLLEVRRLKVNHEKNKRPKAHYGDAIRRVITRTKPKTNK